MKTSEQMLEIAKKYVTFLQNEAGLEKIILNDITAVKLYGNIYHFTSKRYLETNEFKYAIVGNAPFLVEKDTGRIVTFGTANTLEQDLYEYENDLIFPCLTTYWYPNEEKYSHK
jgi:hypothetical protein